MPDHDDDTPLEQLTPEEASRIIHSHRKVRYGTACWPCRQRKVKCDNKQPCENCVKRDHTKLCSYKPNRSSAKHGSNSSDTPSLGRKRPHSPDEDSHSHRDSEQRQDIWVRPVEDTDANTEVTRYLGQNSIPALLREQSGPNDPQEGSIRQDMRSILGLDTSAPFPLMSSRHLDHLTQDISAELPSDREVMKLFRTYRDIPHLFWGFVLDIVEMESKLMEYLEERAKNAKKEIKTSRPVSASWLAILFAVLAVGSQYHDSPYHIRTRDSQKYIQISFHFLRLGNFLLRPTLDSIQALLLTSFVLLNDMKAEASWALLGLTCRLAQSLGLHLPSPQSSRDNTPEDAQNKDMVRRRLWWTCVWHDTLTSLSFDRFTMTSIKSCKIPLSADSETTGWTYLEAMYQLCYLISEHLSPDAAEAATYTEILKNCDEFESIRDKVQSQLRSKASCRTAVDRLQYFAIRLHTSFAMSVCCRPALRRSDSHHLEANQKRDLAAKCKANLTETVRMFLAMHQLSVIPTRSWAFTYHGLSSALLLGLLRDTQGDPEIRQLQGDLISALSATAAKEQTSPPSFISKTDKDIELSGPLSRALTALKHIYQHGGVTSVGIKPEADNTGAAPVALTPTGSVAFPNHYGVQSGVDPHQDAALAMAEMQNSRNIHDLSASIQYSQQLQPSMPVGDLTQFNQSTSMSPLDMYDSIFWNPPLDPWTHAVPLVENFDFLAHPPPGQQPPQQYYF